MSVDLDRFYRDVVADAMTTVLASQWRERADMLRWARPRPGDFPGQATLEERRGRWRRLTAMAEMCEAHADLLEASEPPFRAPEADIGPMWEAA